MLRGTLTVSQQQSKRPRTNGMGPQGLRRVIHEPGIGKDFPKYDKVTETESSSGRLGPLPVVLDVKDLPSMAFFTHSHVKLESGDILGRDPWYGNLRQHHKSIGIAAELQFIPNDQLRVDTVTPDGIKVTQLSTNRTLVIRANKEIHHLMEVEGVSTVLHENDVIWIEYQKFPGTEEVSKVVSFMVTPELPSPELLPREPHSLRHTGSTMTGAAAATTASPSDKVWSHHDFESCS